jgi:uncharacterized protein (DUF362 family)
LPLEANMRTVETIRKTASQIQEHFGEGADNRLVALGMTLPLYNDDPPFHPPAIYPELRFPEVSSGANHPYRLFRNLLFELGCDRRNFGSPLWNPLHSIVQPGMTVLLKPSIDRAPDLPNERLYAAITHPSILRAVIDYVHLALDGTGRIIVAYAPPTQITDEDPLADLRLESIQEYYYRKFQVDIELCDLRDPASNYVPVNPGPESLLSNIPGPHSPDSDNELLQTISDSDRGAFEHRISETVLLSDVFISIPKMKVHDRSGVGLSLAGLTDITTPKDRISDNVHAYDRLLLKAERWLQHHGVPGLDFQEDYAWRVIADLAGIVTFADDKGKIHNDARRGFFCFIDGIIGGENDGPKAPDPKPCGCLAAGENPLAVDMVAARLMGFDIKRLRQYDLMLQAKAEFPSTDKIEVIADGDRMPGTQFFNSSDRNPMFGFRPHPSWAGRIEV